MVRTDGNCVEVALLRPESWVWEEGIELGGELRLHLAELNVDGLAVITKLDQRNDIDAGDVELGNLVTGRFKTLGAMNVVKAIFSDGTEIVGTDIHPVWSVDREDWIALGELQEYERVQTRSGTIHLLSLQRALPADVFNIEVDCHHVYEVGDVGVLVHNACAWKNFENYRAKHYAGQIAKRNGGHGSGADLILENGDWVEQKAWSPKVWERMAGSQRNESMLRGLTKQVNDYIATNPNGRLILEFAWQLPREVDELLKELVETHGKKLVISPSLWGDMVY